MPGRNTAKNSIAVEGPKRQILFIVWNLNATHRAWDRVILWAQKMRETRFAAIEKIRLKSWRAQWPHLPWISSTNGTSYCWEFFMEKPYLSHLFFAFMTDAAPGKYDGVRPDPRRNPLEGLLASIVVTSYFPLLNLSRLINLISERNINSTKNLNRQFCSLYFNHSHFTRNGVAAGDCSDW